MSLFIPWLSFAQSYTNPLFSRSLAACTEDMILWLIVVALKKKSIFREPLGGLFHFAFTAREDILLPTLPGSWLSWGAVWQLWCLSIRTSNVTARISEHGLSPFGIIVFKFSYILYRCGWKHRAPCGRLLKKLERKEKSCVGESQLVQQYTRHHLP